MMTIKLEPGRTSSDFQSLKEEMEHGLSPENVFVPAYVQNPEWVYENLPKLSRQQCWMLHRIGRSISLYHEIHQSFFDIAVLAGWWHDLETGEFLKDRPEANMMMLMHSEISEGFEGHRKEIKDSHLPWYNNLDVEMADLEIRLGDMCIGKGINIYGAIFEKTLYNMLRADHKVENRKKAGGKKI